MAARKKKKRKKSRSKNKKAALGNLNITQLRNTGTQLFNIGKYADSILYFKELGSREPGEESSRLLAQSYQKRVEELQGKEMASEALAVANSMMAQCGMSPQPGQMITLLCQCHKYTEAVAVYLANQESFTGREQTDLEEFFAVSVLAGNKQLLNNLPKDSPICSHYPQAKATLKAFFTKDEDQTARELKKIPFRSPYRHFRLLVSGLLQLENDPAKAQSIFDKLPTASPYYALIDLFSISNMDVKDQVEQLIAARDTNKFNQILTAARLNHEQGSFLTKLFAAKPTAYSKIIRLLAGYAGYFSKLDIERIVMKLILHCPEEPPVLFKKIVENFSESELYHLEAQVSELHAHPREALVAWNNYLQALPVNTPDYSLRRALVLRRQAKFAGQELPFHEEFNPDNGLSLLLESVVLDPEDRETWLQIIQLSQQEESAAEAYRIVKRAVEQFPDDIEFLLKAIEATSQRGAFKKASSFADRLLKIDPINTRGKELLARAHFSHGFKLCAQKKYSLAEKEFAQIDTDSRNRTLAGRSTICLAMLAYLQKDKKQGDALLEKSRTLTSSPLMNALLTSVEGRQMKLVKSRINEFDKTLRTACRDNPFDREECYEIALWLQNSHKEECQSLKESFQAMRKYFNQAASTSWAYQKARMLAEAMYAASLYPQLKTIAANQLKDDYENPYFRFMKIAALTKNGTKSVAWEITEELYDIIDDAWFSDGDESLIPRVEELSRKCRRNSVIRDFDLDDDIESEEIFKILNNMEEDNRTEQADKSPARRGEQMNLFDLSNFGGDK